jgi:concanavalin A-like lectin/glucanase superfamily protein
MRTQHWALALLGSAALSVSLATAQTCDPLPKGIAGWWSGENNGVDRTLAHDDGLLMNGVTFVPGAVGQAFSLDGVDDRVDIPDAPQLRPQRFTLSAWIQLDTIQAQACIICKQLGAGTTNSYSLWLANGVLRGGMFGIAEAVASSAAPTNRLMHTAVTWDGTLIRLYLDGRSIATAVGPTAPIAYDTNQVILGADDGGTNAYGGFLDGIIDEPQIFGRALSPCEIRALSRAHGSCTGDDDADTIPDFQDNCPAQSNAGQQDTDGDGVGDSCDCAPADARVFAVSGNYPGMVFTAHDTLDWCGEPAESGPDTVYDLLRGDLAQLPVSSGTPACRSLCLPPPSGLVAWWPGDADGSALVSGLNGTLENGASVGAGWVRSAFHFDGANDRVRTGALALGNTFSVAAWVNSDVPNQGGYHRILETQYSPGLYLGTDTAGTGYKLIVNNAFAPYGTVQGGTIRPGEWQLVVGTYDGTTGTLYVDGSAVSTGAFTAPGATSLPVNIGAAYSGGVGWRGAIDEVQIFNRVLTAAEVRTLYETASVGMCKASLGGTDARQTAPGAWDAADPTPGHGFWYLFRGENSCGLGPYGIATGGAISTSSVCD